MLAKIRLYKRLYGRACQPARRSRCRSPKITESVRQSALKLPLNPIVIKDSETDGFLLIVTTRRAFWAQRLQPRGLRPDGRRWSVVRHELGDARTMTVAQARTASLKAKAAIGEGKRPPP